MHSLILKKSNDFKAWCSGKLFVIQTSTHRTFPGYRSIKMSRIESINPNFCQQIFNQNISKFFSQCLDCQECWDHCKSWFLKLLDIIMSNSEWFQSLIKFKILFSGVCKAWYDIMDWGLKQTQQMDILSHVQLRDIWLSETLDCARSRYIYLSHLQMGQDWGHKQHSGGNLRLCLLALYRGMQLCSAGVQFLMLPDPYSAINNQKYSLQKWQ